MLCYVRGNQPIAWECGVVPLIFPHQPQKCEKWGMQGVVSPLPGGAGAVPPIFHPLPPPKAAG